MEVSIKRFIVIPRDAFDLLPRRYGALPEAIAAAEADCGESGLTMMVVEMKAIAARADRPVKVRKL